MHPEEAFPFLIFFGCVLNGYHARKAHERHRQDAGGDEGDGETPHAFGDIHQFQVFADAGKNGQGEAKTDGNGTGIDNGLQQVEFFLDD